MPENSKWLDMFAGTGSIGLEVSHRVNRLPWPTVLNLESSSAFLHRPNRSVAKLRSSVEDEALLSVHITITARCS
jgi:16S rRNA G966 N2-methylase RsmD